MKAATEGIESYNNWAKDNPDNAKYLESWFNIGAIATPPTPIKGILSDAGASLQETGAAITKGGLKSIQGTKNELVTAMLEPTNTARIPTEDLKSKGLFDTITYDPDAGYTRDNIDIIAEIPKVDPKKTYTYNSNVIEKARQSEQKKLESILGRTPVVVESDVVTQELVKERVLYSLVLSLRLWTLRYRKRQRLYSRRQYAGYNQEMGLCWTYYRLVET